MKNYFQCVKCIFQIDKDDKNHSDHGIMDPPQLNSNICGTDYLEIQLEREKNRRLMEYLSWEEKHPGHNFAMFVFIFHLQAVFYQKLILYFCFIKLQNILVISQYQRKSMLYWTKHYFWIKAIIHIMMSFFSFSQMIIEMPFGIWYRVSFSGYLVFFPEPTNPC